MKLEIGIGMHATDPCHNANVSQAKWTELSAASVPMVLLHTQPPAESFLSKKGYFSTKKINILYVSCIYDFDLKWSQRAQ